MKYILGLLVVVALIYGGKMYYQQPAETKPVETMMKDEAAVKVFNVSGANFRFDPATINVNQGEKVKVVLTAVDMPHDFDLDELEVNGAVAQPGESVEVEFIADQVGTFEYYCSVGSHRANGMVGKLIVL